MKRSLSMTTASLVLAMAVASCAQQGPVADTAANNAVATPMATLPARVDNFRLVTADGYARELGRYKDASAIVLVMGGAGHMETVGPALAKLEAAYAAKGVEIMVVNSNPKDTREAMLADAAKYGFKSPILQDDLQLVGGQIGDLKPYFAASASIASRVSLGFEFTTMISTP
ncbi:MAG: hypothetical protein EON93_04410, partial [Burkholderiales bacterium]